MYLGEVIGGTFMWNFSYLDFSLKILEALKTLEVHHFRNTGVFTAKRPVI